MNPAFASQDVLRCKLCGTPVPPLFCQLCDIKLCATCVGRHLLDDSKEHRVLPIKHVWNPTAPMCTKHSSKHCELYCKQCNVPICVTCVSSGQHEQHKKTSVFERKFEVLQNELQVLEQTVYPEYQKSVSDINALKDELNKNSIKLKKDLMEQGQIWHREIDSIIKNLQSIIDEIVIPQLANLDKEEDKVNFKLGVISQNIRDLKKIIKAKDKRLASEYRSKVSEFRQMPPSIRAFLLHFTPIKINSKKLSELFGSLSTFEKEIGGKKRSSDILFEALNMDVVRSASVDIQSKTCWTQEEKHKHHRTSSL